MTYRALIIGCGRMGAGRDHAPSGLLYTHIEAYRALKERVEVVGFVDRVLARAEWAAEKWQVPFAGDHIEGALAALEPDIVSICTPPSDRAEPIVACDRFGVMGIWCEKPFAYTREPKVPTQVNYIRRFDRRHQVIAKQRNEMGFPSADLICIVANDIHTTCHLTDLARWWGIPPARFHYLDFHGPSLYILRERGATAGRYSGWRDEVFTGGGVSDGFMQNALANLLDAVDGTAELISPAGNAIESEKWATEILASA